MPGTQEDGHAERKEVKSLENRRLIQWWQDPGDHPVSTGGRLRTLQVKVR
jgi:hypothetical protein